MYKEIKEKVTQIAQDSSRDPKEITLITVSKGHPWQETTPIYQAGCRDFGENRIPEALAKIKDAPKDTKWHFIGHLQKNKVSKAIGPFVLIHSVDSIELAEHISHHSQQATTSILLQVNTSGEQSKQGLTPKMWQKEFEKVARLPHLKIEGLMTMAPLTDDEKIIRTCFANLRKLKDELGLKHLSMGMSHDYPIAIQEGATLLRIGTAIYN